MKRLTKICVIIALILGISGGILFCTGVAMGASWEVVREAAQNGWFGKHFYTDWDVEDTLDDCRDTLKEKAKKEYEFSVGQVQELELDVSNGYVSIVDSGDDKIRVRIFHESDKVEYSREDGELSVEREGRKKYLDKYPVQIAIPVNARLRYADIQIGAGVLEIENLAADELDLEVGAGTVDVSGKITASQASLEAGMGTMDVNLLDSMDTEIQCGMGSVNATLAKSRDAYYAEVDCGIGSVSLGDESYSSVTSSYSGKSENTERNISIECGMGSVDTVFEEAEAGI